LKIDITFDDNLNQSEEDDQLFEQYNLITSGLENKNHLGLASCKLIKNYVENYKCLKEVSIVLKQFLARMGLNSPYHGKFNQSL
jgi:DNA polymerase sigma